MTSHWIWRHCFTALCCVLFIATAASADTVTLQARKDNTLFEDPNGALSNGAGAYLFAGHTNEGKKRRALIAFDVAASIPAGSTITGVTLNLRMSRTKAGNVPVALHRVLADWGEGTSNADSQEGTGAPATTGDATWRHRFYPATFWTTPGGEYGPAASASRTVGGNGVYAWSSSSMVADVQMWLDTPVTNFGWAVIGSESGLQTAKRFDSRENGTIGNRPTLVVTFTPPILTGACCAPLGCSVTTQTNCASQGGIYQGNGTTCSPNPCVQPTGACCAVGGACTLLSSTSCSSSGGTYRGDGTSCSPNPCPQPTGACCARNGTCSAVTQSACAGAGGAYQGDGTTCEAVSCPVLLTPFVDPLPIPAVAQPISGQPGGAATYRLAMTEFQQRLHRDLPQTTVWGFGGTYPGPTIEATSGQTVTVNWVNDLRDPSGQPRATHYLPVDTCLMGPDTAGPTPRTVVHLHGAHVPAEFDGYPEATFLPGQEVTYTYPNLQLPATLWYHDHALGITRLNVIMGLAGFYLLRDPFEASLGLPAGEFEIPLAIQDRTFQSNGSFAYPAAWQDHFFGDKILVNGKVWPYLDVKRGKYRFRLLNGSTSRSYTLSLSRPEMRVILLGTEGGLLPAPVTLERLTLIPGERADVVIDFAGLSAGTEVILTNSAPIHFPGTPGDGVIPDVLKFVVSNQSGFTAPLPATLRPIERLRESDAILSRPFELRRLTNACGPVWLINGLGWHDITEFPELDTTEIWTFINRSGITHPMHMHLVMFQLLDRQPFEMIDGEVVPTGSRVPAPPHEAGWKDTVACNPNELTRVIARFERYTGLYPHHCHIIEHEDNEMMRQFQTIACGNGVPEPTERCDDGNRLDGDLCSSACRFEEYMTLTGTGTGGSVTVIVEGIAVTVTTAAGQSVAQVAAALAAAINADPALRALRVSAFSTGAALVVGGTITDLTIADAGLREALDLRVLRDALWWSSVSGRIGYDVVRGDLGALRAAAGDFSAATRQCLADNRVPTTLPFSAIQAAGEGWWFLVRKVAPTGPGTYDSGGASQSGSRDAGIAASANTCP